MGTVDPGKAPEGVDEEAGVLYEDRTPDVGGRLEFALSDFLEPVCLRLGKRASLPSNLDSIGPEQILDLEELSPVGRDEGGRRRHRSPGVVVVGDDLARALPAPVAGRGGLVSVRLLREPDWDDGDRMDPLRDPEHISDLLVVKVDHPVRA